MTDMPTQSSSTHSPPAVKTYRLPNRDKDDHVFDGRLLGSASSHVSRHDHESEFAPPLWRCSACRWFEVDVYHTLDDPDGHKYVVHTRGPSIVPGEITKTRVACVSSPYEVLRLLTQTRPRDRKLVLPQTSLDALYDAADHDRELHDALNEWLQAGA